MNVDCSIDEYDINISNVYDVVKQKDNNLKSIQSLYNDKAQAGLGFNPEN